MAKSIIAPGADIDGFTVGECVHSGGMATLWSVSHPDIAVPLLMKIPRMSEGEDPAATVGAARAHLVCDRRFRPPGLCGDRAHSGRYPLQAPSRSAACLRRGE